MNKKSLVTIVAVSILGIGLFGVSSTFAQSNTAGNTTLIQAIAEKFGLNKTDVQAVFDSEHEKQHAKMQVKIASQLSQYVKDGKITEEQKQLILNKQKELDANRSAKKDSMQNLTPEERKAQMDAKKTELNAWAKENGIDPQYLMGGFGKKGHRGGMR